MGIVTNIVLELVLVCRVHLLKGVPGGPSPRTLKVLRWAVGCQLVIVCVEINQCVGCANNSSLSHFSAMTWPSWLGRAVRNRHRHAIEQVSCRWRGGRHDDSARTRRKILISTQVIVTLITIGASKPVRNIISRRLRANSTSISTPGTGCSTT